MSLLSRLGERWASGPSGSLMGQGDPSPIDIDGRLPAVLALHGFGGTPLEVELVTDVAMDLGLECHAPLLPGHGTHAKDLAKTGFADWAGAAERALRDVAASEPAIVVGLSCGALIALKLALAHPGQVRGIGLLANSAWLAWPFPAVALEWVERLGLPDFSVPKAGADIADPVARATHLTYSAQPMHAAIEVMRAGNELRPKLGSIRCPVFIAHGKRDRVCPVSNARRVADMLGSTEKRVVILPNSRHIITRDVDRDQLRAELRGFLQAQL